MLIKNIRLASEKLKKPVSIIQDLQGPRIRLGSMPKDGILVKKGDMVIFVPEGYKGKNVPPNILILPTQEALGSMVKQGESILIKDGLVRLVAKSIIGDLVLAQVEQGDILTSARGINLPDSKIPSVVITKKDKEDLKFGLRQKVDWVALSFVSGAKDIEDLRSLFPKSGQYRPKIIAKIERKEAVENFDAILETADAIMVARGDLGIEIASKKIPILQKKMIQKCQQASKPVIVATQMLESMTVNARPTRAEVSDVANAVIDSADALMLSSETSTGKYPFETCALMSEIIRETEDSPFDDKMHFSKKKKIPVSGIIANTAQDVSEYENIKAIVVMSSSGRSASLISSERPQIPILALTQNLITLRQMALIWGVVPFIMERKKSVDELIDASVKLSKTELSLKKGDKIIIATGHPTGPKGSLNLIKVHTL